MCNLIVYLSKFVHSVCNILNTSKTFPTKIQQLVKYKAISKQFHHIIFIFIFLRVIISNLFIIYFYYSLLYHLP